VGFYVDGPDDLEDLGQQESYSYELVSSHMGPTTAKACCGTTTRS